MWSILAVACSLTAIDDCRSVRFSMLGAATQRECRFQGITLTNEWGKKNKGWFIRRWDCDRTEYR
jgi:hypothetical protein